jgi:dTDP-4-amino-4,6-dideoxygalactose transaminase
MTADRPALLGGRSLLTEPVPMVRPVVPDRELLLRDVEAVIASGRLTKGPHVRALEEEVSSHLGVRHAVAVSSCTSGLMLVYRALPPGDVIVPSFTFMATVSALVWAGHRPVFADVDRGTMNIDPHRLEPLVTERTRAIVAVHTFGNPADIERLEEFAGRHGLRLIFDAAHGFGARRADVPLGRQGMAQVFSTSPTKLVVSGEGGVVATDDDDLADYVRSGREYGMSANYDSVFPGINARMPELSAVIGRRSLRSLQAAVERRGEMAARYCSLTSQLPGIGFQNVPPGSRSSFKDFAITVDSAHAGMNRDVLAAALAAEGIETRAYYSPALHVQTAYRQDDRAPLVHTEWLAANVLCLPIWSAMPDTVCTAIVEALTRIWNHAERLSQVICARVTRSAGPVQPR